MLSTHDGWTAFGQSVVDHDRSALPLPGFVLGLSLSVAVWGVAGSIVWLARVDARMGSETASR
jgi:hypothetical protein